MGKPDHRKPFINVPEGVGVFHSFSERWKGPSAAVRGTFLARPVWQRHKDYHADQIRHGGILVWGGAVDVDDGGCGSRRPRRDDPERPLGARRSSPRLERRVIRALLSPIGVFP